MIENMELNGKKQSISIKTNGEDLPLLLYIHGGPGDAALPLVSKYNKGLENHFTVIVWEQRGSGKSYYPFTRETTISVNDFIVDMEQLCLYLLDRFKQEKLYLIGHSWGSVLGLKFTTMFPQYLHRYIGVGQVVNMAKSSLYAKEYALNKNTKVGNDKLVERLKAIDCSYTGANWLENLLFVTGQVVKHGGSLYGKKSYNKFMADFIFSREYSLTDLLNRQKGSLQSIQFLWQELMGVDFENVVHFDVPVSFIEGRHDSHVSSELAWQYYEAITSPKEFYWFEDSAHFPQWEEPEKFNSILISMV